MHRHKQKKILHGILRGQKPTAIASALRGMALREDTSTLLAKSTMPVLIISGEQDKLISPLQSQKMHTLAPNSKLVIIPNAGHLSNLEQPAEWNKSVMDMFD